MEGVFNLIRFVFPVTDRTLHLSGGKVTFYFLSHIASLLRSCCKCALIVDFIPMYAMVSSANSSMVEFIPNGISFIKIQNRLAYMSAPCGTTGALG